MKVIYCAGELGRTILDSIRRTTGLEDIAFIDDDESLHGDVVAGIPVLGSMSGVRSDGTLIIGYGANTETRAGLVENAEEEGWGFFSLVDRDTTTAASVSVGEGVYVNGQCYLGPGAKLGDHSLVDSCVNISHDVVISEGAVVTPGATLAGNVTVGEKAYIGPNATVLKQRTVGENAVVGAGAVVTDDVAPGETVVGVPARPIS
ncbi:NeuD/PglB/VioB family sugar acetyltransferase [Halobacterium jilantaiense]|uniref:Sugar O-acyltransferase, sialic acid O-acetyltransferase NeuD family n=1 Tax=Halobacterium jilantaiense TaxID=355548 RepID=A0A1I0MSS2_9EURY|nr:NeuD/PglB/VioB family sugar acetyltransferase [Halobacterium jilantaiense]SEV91797.1 sugar O-acyltransferase, sialic acid O-acetyltransferase NeuD family [Halobacterium jilantaiense]